MDRRDNTRRAALAQLAKARREYGSLVRGISARPQELAAALDLLREAMEAPTLEGSTAAFWAIASGDGPAAHALRTTAAHVCLTMLCEAGAETALALATGRNPADNADPDPDA